MHSTGIESDFLSYPPSNVSVDRLLCGACFLSTKIPTSAPRMIPGIDDIPMYERARAVDTLKFRAFAASP